MDLKKKKKKKKKKKSEEFGRKKMQTWVYAPTVYFLNSSL